MAPALRQATAHGAAAVLRWERTRAGVGGPLAGPAARRGPVGPPSVTPTETVKNRLRGGPAG